MPLTQSVPLDFHRLTDHQMRRAAGRFLKACQTRRSIRHFSADPIPSGVLESCLLAANTAPSGANLQPWHFAVVSDPDTKLRIRQAAESEERAFYAGRAPAAWLNRLAPLGTGPEKPFLTEAPALVAVFQQARTTPPGGGQDVRTYYPKESVGIATGILITALHHAGLATLTHTPSPMAFLNRLLDRPATEKPFVLLVVGFPAEGCTVPALTRKSLAESVSLHPPQRPATPPPSPSRTLGVKSRQHPPRNPT